jgi:aminoglycoside phosphotransferase (APT) family kinase protein
MASSDPDRLTAAAAAAIIRAQFPETRPIGVAYLGEGCDSIAFDVDGAWVFRFPKRADVEAQLLLEARVLPRLNETAPLPLPAFRFQGRPSPEFPRHFVGYPKLPGTPAMAPDARRVPLERWATALGGFLSWLHTFPMRDFGGLGVPEQSIALVIETVRADALDDLPLVRDVSPGAPIDVWRAFLRDAPGAPDSTMPRCLVHNDLAAEHVLCDPAREMLTGVIDWSEMAVSDPAVDIAALYHWGGERFVHAVLAHYRGVVDAGMLNRARYLGACRGAADVGFGLGMGRPDYVEAGLRALTFCAGAGMTEPPPSNF